MADRIHSAFDPSFFEDFVKASKQLDDYVAQIAKAAQMQIAAVNTGPDNLKDLITKQKELATATVQVHKATQDAEKSQAALNREAKLLEKQLAVEAKQAAELSNDYGQLSKAYNEAALRAKNYVLQLGAQHSSSIQAIADAKRMADQLKQLDAAVGQNQRNVGNYTSAFNGLGMSIQQVARELPNFAISFRTGIQALSNNLPILADEIRRVRMENAALVAEGKPTTSVLKQIAQSVFNWQTALIALITALVAYAPKIAEFISGTKDAAAEQKALKEATEGTTTAIKDQIDAMFKSRQREGNRLNIGEGDAKRRLDLLKAQGASEREIGIAQNAYNEARKKNIQNEIDSYKLIRDEINRAGQFFKPQEQGNDKLNDPSSTVGGFFSLSVQKTLRESLKLTAEEAKKQADIIVKSYGTALSPVKDLQTKILDLNEELKNIDNEGRVANADRKKKQADKDEKEAEKRRKKGIKDREDEKKDDEQATKQELQRIRGRFEQRKAIATEAANNEKLSEKERQNNLEKAMLAEVSIVKLSGAIEKRTREEIEADITEVTIKYARLRGQITEQEAQEQLDRLKRHRANIQAAGAATGNAATSSQRPSGVLGWGGAEMDKFNNAALYADAAINSEKAIMAIEKARSDARIQQITDEISAIQSKRDADIEAVNLSTISEQEKARKISEINARARAEEKQRNDEIRAEKRRQAEINKAMTIAEIVIRTALAVVNQLATGDGYSAIPRAIAVGAMGAAELASAIATPIPSFAVGTEDAPEGVAQVHKGELIMPSDGSKPYVVDKDTLTYLKKGSVVKTADETAEIFKYYALGLPALRPQQAQSNEDLLNELQESRDVLKQIRDKRYPHQRAQPQWWEAYYHQKTK